MSYFGGAGVVAVAVAKVGLRSIVGGLYNKYFVKSVVKIVGGVAVKYVFDKVTK